MSSAIVSFTLVLSMGSTGGLFSSYRERQQQGATHFLPPGPGYGYGFPNGNPDGYGWHEVGTYLPIGADRTAEYYFRRYWAVPADQMFLSTYYNPYVMRGQRYLPYTGCGGGIHPASGPPMGLADTPSHPYSDTIGSGPVSRVPSFSGRVEAPALPSAGSTGLTP
ncbi:MAG: hypothetical protein P4L84_16430 [Isosphaeraceae bacterium]|nr:hypothetical protein [Isosphaeraceae bacterium]